HRLFHEEQTRIYPASELSFFCTCSKPRIAAAIAQLGQDELNSMVQEQGKIDSTCEFCQQHYSFDQAQVDALFSSQPLHGGRWALGGGRCAVVLCTCARARWPLVLPAVPA